jgi:hypothetical protein
MYILGPICLLLFHLCSYNLTSFTFILIVSTSLNRMFEGT